ncbi:cytochrome P450 [Streptomyces bambusae]|uniref:cytochrome P450 n=1 Tax=Streptomyces bambusae TaxID=1550616 RepID=UPI001CFDC051|nr:cytochrome P450 [Streptomyces bambusae]MCB5165528.1 cytochrome P450 [Streptomyces bambusae]
MASVRTKVPGPAGNPLLGSLLDLVNDPLGTYLRIHREHGDVVRIPVGPPGLRTELYAVYSAEGAQQVLGGASAANFRKDNAIYQEIRESLGNGLLTSQDQDYLRQRRLVQPLFTRRRVDGYAAAVAEETARVLDAWPGLTGPDGGIVDVGGQMMGLALRTVARILFGADVDAAADVVDRSFPQITEYTIRRGYAPVKPPRHWPTPGNRRAAAAIAELYGVCDRIIAERGPAGAGDEGEDLLSLLAAARSAEDGAFDTAELRDQVLIFLLAGHETTAVSLAFTLHLLARHPAEQDLVRTEIAEVLGGRTPEAADLEKLPRLNRVLKESMRLYPAAPLLGRRAVAEAEVGGQVIPAGADVILSPWVTHRHPRYWPDPERFDPDRFLPEAEAERPRYAWYPFGGGPRACIGQHFSMLESVIALAMLLRDYAFEPVTHPEHGDAVPVTAGITLTPQVPIRCRVRPLNR